MGSLGSSYLSVFKIWAIVDSPRYSFKKKKVIQIQVKPKLNYASYSLLETGNLDSEWPSDIYTCHQLPYEIKQKIVKVKKIF